MTSPRQKGVTMANPLGSPPVRYVRAFLGAYAARARGHWADGERGASAVELAIITGVLVVMAVGVLVVILKEVGAGSSNISQVIPTSTAG